MDNKEVIEAAQREFEAMLEREREQERKSKGSPEQVPAQANSGAAAKA